MIDGSDLFEIRGNTLVRTEGYAPLIGKDWGNNYSGEIYEPLNMLTPKGRISYIVQDPPTSFLSTHYEVERVDAVYVNGELRDPETYGVDKRLRWLSVSGLSAGDRVLAYYTFVSDMKSRETLCKNPHAMVFGGINNSRIFVWGGEDKKRMFASAPVSQRSLEASALVYPDSGGIYFPESNNFCVGDGKHDIRAVSRHYDRLLIFTSGDTWMADSEVSSLQMFPLTRINTDVGCASIHGVAKCGNDPISVGHGNIYRWTSNTDTLEDCNARIISDGIKDILPSSFFEDAVVFTDRHNSEVLFAYRDTTEGCVLVYSIPCNSWYIYRGISVDHFFEGESSLGFVNGGKICLFERGRTADSFSDGSVRSIYGYCTYSPNSFGHPTRKKRISGIMGIGELKQKELKITFESERGITESVSFAGGDSGGVECFYKRLRGERFKTSKIKISTDPTVRQRIYSLTVTVRP